VSDAVWDEATRHGVVNDGAAQAPPDPRAPDTRLPRHGLDQFRLQQPPPPDRESADPAPNGDTNGDPVLQGVFVDGGD
jgi:hypothetical protein